MSRLNWECRRAFLDQCLNRVCVDKLVTSSFFKYLFISKRLLICSRSKYSKIYRLILFKWESNQPQFCVVPYLDQNFDRTHDYFPLKYEYALKLINLLCPSLFEVQFYGPYSVIEKNLDKYNQVLGLDSVKKIACCVGTYILPDQLEQLLVKYASKMCELECNYSFGIPPKLPAMSLDYCYLRYLKSTDDMWDFLNDKQIKKLGVCLTSNDTNEIQDLNDYNFDGSLEKRQRLDDIHINSSVIELKLESAYCGALKNLTKVVKNARESFPRLRKLNLETRLYDRKSLFPLDRELDSNLLIETILKYHRNFKSLERICKDLPFMTSIEFRATLYCDVEKYKSDWINELMKRREFKLAEYIRHENDYKQCDQLYMESGNDKSNSFDINLMPE